MKSKAERTQQRTDKQQEQARNVGRNMLAGRTVQTAALNVLLSELVDEQRRTNELLERLLLK
jgi:hypothetical protein